VTRHGKLVRRCCQALLIPAQVLARARAVAVALGGSGSGTVLVVVVVVLVAVLVLVVTLGVFLRCLSLGGQLVR
jgi:hypothetical protein